jgi:hypothetical protein
MYDNGLIFEKVQNYAVKQHTIALGPKQRCSTRSRADAQRMEAAWPRTLLGTALLLQCNTFHESVLENMKVFKINITRFNIKKNLGFQK